MKVVVKVSALVYPTELEEKVTKAITILSNYRDRK
jgi:predicted RNA binding protein with dsRBD fold (UPF0201 family)